MMTTPGMVRERLRFERARLLQQGDLPSAAAVYQFALRLEVWRRIQVAEAEDDQDRLVSLLLTAGRWAG
jgi:hypothetical protein